MKSRISPLWWPALAVGSPVLAPALAVKYKRFKANVTAAKAHNRALFESAAPLDLPGLERFSIRVVLEAAARDGYGTAPGVSYLIETNRGRLLFDLGFGDEDPALERNLAGMSPDLDQVDAVVISHLHPDHMGGFNATKQRAVPLPRGCGELDGKPCWVPEPAASTAFEIRRVAGPQLITAGVGTTGPLARSLFLMGPIMEQALVARIRGKGVVVVTGCGHPTIHTILDLVRRLTDEKIYAVAGGLHLPVTDSPLKRPGLKVQMIWGTGKPPWQRITDRDVDRAIAALNRAGVKKLLISPHDICGHAIERLSRETRARAVCLEAGRSYAL